MKSRRRINSNRRKFKKTNNKIHRKSRRNTKKNMIGGAAEHIHLGNTEQPGNANLLDQVGNGLLFRRIDMSKIFTSKDDAEKFESDSIPKIGEKNILSQSGILPYGKKTKTIEKREKRLFRPDLVTTQEVPVEEYLVGFSTNENGKVLALELIAERENLPPNMKDTIDVQVVP